MIHRARSLAVVIALGLPGVAAAQPKKGPDPVSAFLQQDKYTYCDVKILSALWKVSIEDAKANVGRKLHDEKYLTTQLANARAAAKKIPTARCTFGDAGFGYPDAEKLAKLWKKTPGQAKAMAEDKILAGGEHALRELLGYGQAPGEDPVQTFVGQDKYSYCDVKVLSGRWKTSISDAKTRVGAKLQAHAESYLDSELVAARKAPKQACTYMDAGLTFNDVEKLAKMWKMSVDKAKVFIGKKVTTNGTGFLREALGGPGTQQDADLQAFFAQAKYTYCDAAMIAAMWKKSVDEGKAFIGFKLSAKNTAAIDGVLAQARKTVKQPVDGCESPKAPPPKAPPPKTPPAKK